MNLQKNIEKTFEDNNIKYFKGASSNENIFNVPYRGIDDSSNHINIYIDINEELNRIRFTIVEKSNYDIPIDEIKSQLLDINASLQYGSLSMISSSDSIEYKVDYFPDDEGFLFSDYNFYIIRCIRVYELLKHEAIIR